MLLSNVTCVAKQKEGCHAGYYVATLRVSLRKRRSITSQRDLFMFVNMFDAGCQVDL